MQREQLRISNEREGGYVLLGILVLLGLGMVITGGMIDSATTNLKTRALVKTRAEYYYESEETLNKVVAWMQQNSKSLVDAFTAANFDNNFDRGNPSLGDNEGEHFGVHTMVKLAGTGSTAMLSNNDFFGTPAFPAVRHAETNAPFDAVAAFRNANLGEANARVVLVWARETDATFEPVFRVDVVTGNNPDRGAHSFSYVYTTVAGAPASVGFYGRSFLTLNTPNNDCYSYRYTFNAAAGTWSRGAPRSNCPVASDSAINISSKVYGTAKTLLAEGVALNPPGGDVSGGMCEGAGCHAQTLPVLSTWAAYCPAHSGNVTIAANTSWDGGGCWQDVTINNNRTLTLNDYENPYYFRTLRHAGNHAKIAFGTIPPGEKIRIYVQDFDMNALHHINGNKLINGNNAPHQIEWYYLGANTLMLEGNAELNGKLYAPNAEVRVSGNFNYYGEIHARQLLVSGNARINWDETEAVVAPTDMKFALKKASQRYR